MADRGMGDHTNYLETSAQRCYKGPNDVNKRGCILVFFFRNYKSELYILVNCSNALIVLINLDNIKFNLDGSWLCLWLQDTFHSNITIGWCITYIQVIMLWSWFLLCKLCPWPGNIDLCEGRYTPLQTIKNDWCVRYKMKEWQETETRCVSGIGIFRAATKFV